MTDAIFLFFPSCFVQVEMFTCIIYLKERGTLCVCVKTTPKKEKNNIVMISMTTLDSKIYRFVYTRNNLYDAFMMGLEGIIQ